ncbi:hypothetical protein STCU_08026 [Strigomonas culicis]|uniref:MI domain-containing protein n=1 Tax=Strigomonas culicis TaxID=28005 RepID=S9U1X4_9TRYP|nr:hypothetical protein STCU_08026 [Strigomonas culicis]|eukprot:EPY22933.1 hypothetical protein STCU_08026 [Strigomonas culicis]
MLTAKVKASAHAAPRANARLWGEDDAPAPAPGAGEAVTAATLAEAADDAEADAVVAVPPAVQEQARRAVNRLAIENFAALAQSLSQLFLDGTHSRHVVGRSVLQEMERLTAGDTAALEQGRTLPFAALLRGLQLLHGAQLGAELICFWCQRLHRYIVGRYLVRSAGPPRRVDETAASNMLLVLAQLYLLSGTDAVLMISLLEYLLALASLIYKPEGDRTAAADRALEEEVAMCAAACGLELLRACGAKLLKEVPARMEQALRRARARHTRYVAGGPGDGAGRPIKSIRLETLLEVMSTIAAGRLQDGKRSQQEGETSIVAVQQGLTRLLAGELEGGAKAKRGGAPNYHHYLRMVQSSNQLAGLQFCAVLRASKPPRWYALDVLLDWTENTNRNRYTAAAALDGEDADPAAPTAAARADDASTEEESDDDDDGTDAYALRQAEIKRMRLEEGALAGQHLVSESKKEIFRLVTHAGDDMECFSMLLYRDPGFQRFHETAQVLLQCARQEARYNPFYGHVLQRFVSASAKASAAAASSVCGKVLQFAIWDCFKAIKLEPELDVVGAINLARLLCYLFEEQTFFLGVLRGLDLDASLYGGKTGRGASTGVYNKNINLFTRLLLLRMFLELSPARLTAFFFGGDGFQLNEKQSARSEGASASASHDAHAYKKMLALFIEHHFLDEAQAKKWLPAFYDVLAFETPFDDVSFRNNNNKSGILPAAPTAEERLKLFLKRVRVAHKALKQGIH